MEVHPRHSQYRVFDALRCFAAHEKYEGTVIKKIKKNARRALTNDVRRANLY